MERQQPEPQPWEGRVLPMHPPDEARQDIQLAIIKTLDENVRQTSFGMVSTELSAEVARRAHETSEDAKAPYKSQDVLLELSRMIGGTIRMAPNNELFVDHDYLRHRQERSV